jgi:pimeloyl-ACP methyl ester carboxylesterase
MKQIIRTGSKGALVFILAINSQFVQAQSTISYLAVKVDGLNIFYREAGPKDAPTILFLHGFPSSSRMFESLFPLLSARYHLIAPDYPGFGYSDCPDPHQFPYTFDHLAAMVDSFADVVGLKQYTLYMQDYGGPIGFRLALANPGKVKAMIIHTPNPQTAFEYFAFLIKKIE